jgi:anti-sigma factor RsiW
MQHLVHGYVDGEVDLVRTLEIEQHLRECPACSVAVASHQALRTRLNGAGLYHQAPPRLRERIQSSLRQADRSRPAARAWPWGALAVAASVAFIALIAWWLVHALSMPSADDLRGQEVVAAHARSLMIGPLVEVRSTNKHKIKPWFNDKVDVSPPVENFENEGFPLVGARLDYPLDNRKAAVLVYKRRDHFINVFIWRAETETDQELRTMTRQGYHLIHWTHNGLAVWVISDLNEEELRQFVRLLQRGTPRHD